MNLGLATAIWEMRATDEQSESKVGESGAMRGAGSNDIPGGSGFGQVSRELRRRGADRRRPIALQPRRSEGARPIVHVQLGARHQCEPDASRFRLVSAAAGRVKFSGLRR